MAPEVEQRRAVLDGLGASVLKKLAGLSEEDAQRTVDSSANLAGLVQHLKFVESMWFEEIVVRDVVTRQVRLWSHRKSANAKAPEPPLNVPNSLATGAVVGATPGNFPSYLTMWSPTESC